MPARAARTEDGRRRRSDRRRGPPSAQRADKKDLPAAIAENTAYQAQMLFESHVLAEAVKNGESKPDTDDSVTVHIVSGVYDLATGQATLTPVKAPAEAHAPAGR